METVNYMNCGNKNGDNCQCSYDGDSLLPLLTRFVQ